MADPYALSDPYALYAPIVALVNRKARPEEMTELDGWDK
jgi:hypothetical protein